MAGAAVLRRAILRLTPAGAERFDDSIALERALEVRVNGRPLAITLRTPGDDEDLALGFLAGEGVITSASDVHGVALTQAECADEPDVADVALAPGLTVDWTRLERHFAATAACGLCGRAHLDALRTGLRPVSAPTRVSLAALLALPDRVVGEQVGFGETGGLHAAVWCDAALAPRVLREDVGRHNAVDKVCGWLLARGERPAPGGLVWVSGRAGAELVLKAARAGIPVLAAVGAPSSLAIELAVIARMTLVGFMREGRLNVYTGEERIVG